jgi:hypothetical protein
MKVSAFDEEIRRGTMGQKKNTTSPYYQGDLIFILAMFFLISVIAVYAAEPSFSLKGYPAKQLFFYLLAHFGDRRLSLF